MVRKQAREDQNAPLLTPDGRYYVVRGRLRRAPNPHLPAEEREWYEALLREAERDVARAKKRSDPMRLVEVRARMNEIKRGLGLIGPPWWTDDAPDLSRRMARNTIYADWFAAVSAKAREPV
jgi:hypothetical protein